MTKITGVEASLEQFKLVLLAYEKETSNRFHRMQESIDKNKADVDKQFSEQLQLLKAVQPPTTLPTTIPQFEENSGQCFSSDEVEKEELILTSAVEKGDFTRPILAVKEDLSQVDKTQKPLDSATQPTKPKPTLDKNMIPVSNSFNVLDNDDDDCFVNKESETFVNDSDSEEVDEDLIMDGYNSKPTDNAVEGASTPVPNVVNVHWSWTSNASMCSKGSRIILGWNQNDVDLSVLNQEDQVIHTRSWFRGDKKELFCDFNAALMLDDKLMGSSRIDISMREFKECVDEIDIMDLQSGHAIFQPYRISDHSPAVLCIPTLVRPKPKPFKFVNVLTQHKRFHEVVAAGWSRDVSGFHMYKVVMKLRNMKKAFRKLMYDHGNLHENVKRLRIELDTVQRDLDRDPFNAVLREEEAVYVQAFNEAVLLEERFLRQSESLPNVFVSHYEVVLGQAGSDGEIKDALFSMGNDKSPGPDGYTAAFFKESWTIIAAEFKQAIRDKIIANRIKESLKVLVNPNQSAFIPGRSIADNILLTQELMHNYHLDHGTPRFAWNVVCLPRKEGGLGIRRNIHRGGFHHYTKLNEVIDNGQFIWPHSWYSSFPNLDSIQVPHIRPGVRDKLEWVSLDGHVQPFSVQVVWQSIRPRSDNVGWFRCVWFPGCIPRHAFHMWLIMRRRLKTQDNLKRWDNVDARNNKLRSLAGLTNANPSMDSIIQLILPFAGRKSSRSVISKLVLAAAAYFLWQERNNRLFRKEKRSIDQVVDCIINSVRLKLVSCRWKSSRAALDIIKCNRVCFRVVFHSDLVVVQAWLEVNVAQMRRIFLDGYGVLLVRTVIFKCLRLSSRMHAF
ncbi:hypothetical protein Tco_0801336 [Tanacetum coccineum]|uniref:Reverse transcriptase zinc-binding domain-containing protein n=1 Tax=Tanacetum coccineum TaxID=301880 RepID=A0ABQ4ZZW5_9ASTR